MVIGQDLRRRLGDEIGIAQFLLRACHFLLKQRDLFEHIVLSLLEIGALHGCADLG